MVFFYFDGVAYEENTNSLRPEDARGCLLFTYITPAHEYNRANTKGCHKRVRCKVDDKLESTSPVKQDNIFHTQLLFLNGR